MVDRLLCMQEVAGSSPAVSIKKYIYMKYLIQKDKNRRNLFNKTEKTQRALKSIIYDDNYDIEKRLKAQQRLHKLGTRSSRTKIKNRCLRSSRAKSVYRKFKISRIELRELALKGAIPGYSKKSW